MIEVSRSFAGVQIRGRSVAISIYPVSDWRRPDDPTISVCVDGRSPDWGGDWARLTSDQRLEFILEELQLAPASDGTDELRALRAPHAGLPGFRTGVTLALEPGMRACLEAELPRVARVTQLGAALCKEVEAHLGRTLEQYAWSTVMPHERDALLNVAAGVIIGGRTPVDAIRYAVLLYRDDRPWAFADDGDDPQYAELGVALRHGDVQALLGGWYTETTAPNGHAREVPIV